MIKEFIAKFKKTTSVITNEELNELVTVVSDYEDTIKDQEALIDSQRREITQLKEPSMINVSSMSGTQFVKTLEQSIKDCLIDCFKRSINVKDTLPENYNKTLVFLEKQGIDMTGERATISSKNAI